MKNYNPDVLNCLANLSNDEVFTPPVLANQVLDMLPQDLFCRPDTKFLDPVSKSGVFLREIVKRLDRGLQLIIPDRQQRIDHIMHYQVFGLVTTELTSYISRRSLYCSREADSQYSVSHFDNAEGNIVYRNLRHTWQKGKCKYCGASQEVYDRTAADEHYAYQFIHTDNPQRLFPNMKFDVIIGNPPYQLSTGSVTAQAIPLYQKFVEQAKKLSPNYLAMIIPSRWYSGGMGLDDFRRTMLNDNRIKVLVDYKNASDCFPGINLGGGVCYFLWDKAYRGKCQVINIHNGEKTIAIRPLNEFNVFVKYNSAVSIIHKAKIEGASMSSIVSSISPFGISTKVRGTDAKSKMSPYRLFSSKDVSYIAQEDIITGKEYINKYKVLLSQLVPGKAGEVGKDGKHAVFAATMQTIGKGDVCTHSYLIVGSYDKYDEATNLYSYMRTNFVRFLVYMSVSSIHLTKSSFQFVPLQDFSHPWTDEMLYKKYGLTDEEIAFIESMIRPME